MSISFYLITENITKNYIKFLYHVLSQKKFNISHNKLPTFESHSNFVKSLPYFKWFIVKQDNINIGSVYINHDNSIGLNILDEYKSFLPDIIIEIEKNFQPQEEIKSIRSKNFFYNVNPHNEFVIDTLKSLNYEISKVSLRKIKI